MATCLKWTKAAANLAVSYTQYSTFPNRPCPNFPQPRLSSSSVRSVGSFPNGMVPPKTQLFIDNKFVDSSTSNWIDVHNPATNEVVTK